MSASDRLNRTAKLFADDGSAASLDEATEIHRSYVLQVIVGRGIGESLTRQTVFATVVNTGARAFAGGVHVVVDDDAKLEFAWARGASVSDAVVSWGGTIVSKLDDRHPTVVIGSSAIRPGGTTAIYPTWQGWVGAVVVDPSERLLEQQECALAGVLAGGLAVSEAFQHRYGFLSAGQRAVGVSLWAPAADWRHDAGVGPELQFLPASLWLAGLGHLGQAYAWAIGCLPYPRDAAPDVMLQDFDVIVDANASTGVLCDLSDVGESKTRIVARRLESIGCRTAITERPFDAHTIRTRDEPTVVLAGFDRPEPRRELEPADHAFQLAIDAGLGGGLDHYADILVQTFPASVAARDAFPDSHEPSTPVDRARAYDEFEFELIEGGEEVGAAKCGAIDVAGRSVAVAFVGSVASSLVLAEPLRVLHGGMRHEVVALSLRSPEFVDSAPSLTAQPHIPFVRI